MLTLVSQHLSPSGKHPEIHAFSFLFSPQQTNLALENSAFHGSVSYLPIFQRIHIGLENSAPFHGLGLPNLLAADPTAFLGFPGGEADAALAPERLSCFPRPSRHESAKSRRQVTGFGWADGHKNVKYLVSL